jgi:hypothetical protein
VGTRAFHRWLTRAYRPLFPHLPAHTRLFRLCKTHQDWTRVFLAAPTLLGVIDTSGLARLHPIRAGRRPPQMGRTGVSNHRWLVGGTLGLLVPQDGWVVGWACATAHVADQPCQWRLRQCAARMMILRDTGCHAAAGDPRTLQLCQRGEWQERMLGEAVVAMLTLVGHRQQGMQRGWAYCQARLACTMAAFKVLVRWHGLRPTASGVMPLSIAECSL